MLGKVLLLCNLYAAAPTHFRYFKTGSRSDPSTVMKTFQLIIILRLFRGLQIYRKHCFSKHSVDYITYKYPRL